MPLTGGAPANRSNGLGHVPNRVLDVLDGKLAKKKGIHERSRGRRGRIGPERQ
jgi:hypothetical protein